MHLWFLPCSSGPPDLSSAASFLYFPQCFRKIVSALDFVIRQIRKARIFPNCPSKQAHIPIISVKELKMNDMRIPISIMKKRKKIRKKGKKEKRLEKKKKKNPGAAWKKIATKERSEGSVSLTIRCSLHENLFQCAFSAHTSLPGGCFRSHFLTFLIGTEACVDLAFSFYTVV